MKCTHCTRTARPNRKLCEGCTKSNLASNKRQKELLREQGLCITCRQPAGALRCEICTLKNSLRRLLGSTELLHDALRLYNDQKGRCGYTGLPITIGVDASLDHKTPRSKGGDHSIQNLHWVHSGINRLKADMDHEDFKAFLVVLRDSLAGASLSY